jgi:hypothetical protein
MAARATAARVRQGTASRMRKRWKKIRRRREGKPKGGPLDFLEDTRRVLGPEDERAGSSALLLAFSIMKAKEFLAKI